MIIRIIIYKLHAGFNLFFLNANSSKKAIEFFKPLRTGAFSFTSSIRLSNTVIVMDEGPSDKNLYPVFEDLSH
jgi:hypothetical protein